MSKLPLFQIGRSGGIDFSQNKKKGRDIFLFIYIFSICFIFLIILIRLFQLTIVKGDYFNRLSENNRIREIVIEPERGDIIDRKGFVISRNIPNNLKNNNDRLVSKREYESPEAVGQIIGYRQIADKNDIKDDHCLTKLKAGDKTGKKGVEKLFDCELRGVAGKKLIEVDAKGRYLKTITILPPKKGKTIQLALDIYLQKKTYELLTSDLSKLGKEFIGLKNIKASVIGLKPKTGEVLIFVSVPTYNPQDFENNNQEMIGRYLNDEARPLFNRISEGIYAPGSVFKPVVATAALEEKKITEKTIIEDNGSIKAGPLTFGNWYFLQYGKTEGPVNITKAIKRSNDIFFYKTGELLGPEKIKKWAEKFNYGQLTKIGFEESEGTIPSPFWKEDVLKEQWYLGDTYNFSIGQGYLQTTPIQVAVANSVFANDGYLCRPMLLKNGRPNCMKIPISKNTLDIINEGMRQACASGGTGWPLFDFKVKDESTPSGTLMKKINVACKTGTAESHAKSGLPHAWLTTYAPAEYPELILTVLVEEAGQGSDIAAPIAKEIFKAYFERKE